VIKGCNIYHSYNGISVLCGIDIEIGNGETVAIVGPSGSGKSTLLHILGGIMPPVSGSVLFGDTNIYSLKEDELNRFRAKNIGFILQLYNLISNLTVIENVLLPSQIMGNNNKDKAINLISSLGLSHRTAYLPNRLSSGETQRVTIARALMNDPSIIIADEPTGSLDIKMAEEVFNLLVGLVEEENKALIIATHNEKLAKMCDRIFKLVDGKLAE